MSAVFVPGKPDYKPIKMQTRCGKDIENKQVYDFSPGEVSRFPDYRNRFGASVSFRNKPNPIYNCHGMTFACGRTTVGDESVQMILDDDGYTKVSVDKVLPGDVIIYYTDKGEVTHSGVVAARPVEDGLKIPWVVSKWGKYSEVYHGLSDCPYKYAEVRFWRITK